MTEPAPCPLCRHTNPPRNRFCGSCGSPGQHTYECLLKAEKDRHGRHAASQRAIPADTKSSVARTATAAIIAKKALRFVQPCGGHVAQRSDERRAGEEGRSRWSADPQKKNT